VLDKNTKVSKDTVPTGSAIERRAICYMAPLSPEMPSSDRVLYVFYDFETTQNTKVTAPPYMYQI
jgi:hypothetical protein